MPDKDIYELKDDECKQLLRILKPYLQNGTVELRQTKDGILIYSVRRKEIKRLSI